MSPILVATIAGLATALCWGTQDWLVAKSSKKLGYIEINFVYGIIALIAAVVLLILSDFSLPNSDQLTRIIIAEALITVAFLLFVKALSSGLVGIIVPLCNSYPLVTVLLAVIFLNQVFTGSQLGAMTAIVLGAGILAYEKNHKKIPLKELHREKILALSAMTLFGTAFFVLDPVAAAISWQSLVIILYVISVIFAGLILVVTKRSQTLSLMKQAFNYKVVWVAGVLGTLGGVTLYVGSDYAGSVVIPVVLSSGSTLIASFWGAVFEHERIGALKRVGAVVIVAGIVILNIA